MSADKKKNTLSREEARALYDDLKRRMTESVASGKTTVSKTEQSAGAAIAEEIRKALNGKPTDQARPSAMSARQTRTDRTSINVPKLPINRGNIAAVMLVLSFAALRIVWSGLEASGIATATLADASISRTGELQTAARPKFDSEEVQVLKTLDSRRAELEERGKKIDARNDELNQKEIAFTARLTELRELTEKLKLERDKDDKRKNGQLDQLANVYGAMSPQEAAQLIEQLDETIALQLIQRMPEKRVGQILALMTPQRALSITRSLSGKSS